MAKKRTFKEFKQGIFKPINKNKNINKKNIPIIYRSALEMRLMVNLDKNPNVISWSSEQVIVQYKNPVKSAQTGFPQYSRYIVDFYVKLKDGDKFKELLIEVKPHSQTLPPKSHGNKKQSTLLYEAHQWAINSAKWEAADKHCKKHNMQFIIITEKNIDQMFNGK